MNPLRNRQRLMDLHAILLIRNFWVHSQWEILKSVVKNHIEVVTCVQYMSNIFHASDACFFDMSKNKKKIWVRQRKDDKFRIIYQKLIESSHSVAIWENTLSGFHRVGFSHNVLSLQPTQHISHKTYKRLSVFHRTFNIDVIDHVHALDVLQCLQKDNQDKHTEWWFVYNFRVQNS